MVPKAAKSKPPEQRILLELQFLKKISPNLQRTKAKVGGELGVWACKRRADLLQISASDLVC